jgi:hypothetical protein
MRYKANSEDKDEEEAITTTAHRIEKNPLRPPS